MVVPADLVEFPNVRVARIERILEEPAVFLEWFTDELGIPATDDDIAGASAAIGDGAWVLPRQPAGRAQALVEALGEPLLEEHDYPEPEFGTARQLAGRTEMAITNAALRLAYGAGRTGGGLSERLVKATQRWRAKLEAPEDR